LSFPRLPAGEAGRRESSKKENLDSPFQGNDRKVNQGEVPSQFRVLRQKLPEEIDESFAGTLNQFEAGDDFIVAVLKTDDAKAIGDRP